MTVAVADEQPRTVPVDRLRALAEHVLAAEGVPEAMELTVLLVDEPAIAELNRDHLGGDGPTDVLAFPMDRPDEATGSVPAILGDVVLCPVVAERQAGGQPSAELEMLLIHGILHLLGHDHAEEDERRVMFARTDALLADFRRVYGDPPGPPEPSDPPEAPDPPGPPEVPEPPPAPSAADTGEGRP